MAKVSSAAVAEEVAAECVWFSYNLHCLATKSGVNDAKLFSRLVDELWNC